MTPADTTLQRARRAWRERKRAAGLCQSCGREPATNRCAKCQAKTNEWRRKKYARQHTGAAQFVPGKRCALCGVRHREGVRCFKREAA